jgi:hypothetical protein
MVNNEVAFLYPGESSNAHTPQMFDSLPSHSQEIILANMRQSVSLTLGILKSLYPRCRTPFRERGNEAFIRVPRMFKSHV